jgi:hypothetical protein
LRRFGAIVGSARIEVAHVQKLRLQGLNTVWLVWIVVRAGSQRKTGEILRLGNDFDGIARRTLVGERWRALSIKSLYLAIFAAEVGESAPSAERMRAWNEMYPDWSHTHVGHFAQDSSDALRRLMREPTPEPPEPRRRLRQQAAGE